MAALKKKDLEKQIKASSAPWLVKSSGRVIGPFSRREVEEGLKTREIVPLDEISRPLQRWKYLRDETVFCKLVASVSNTSANFDEQTMTSTIDAQTVVDELTETGEQTVTITETVGSEPTPTEEIVETGRAEKISEPTPVLEVEAVRQPQSPQVTSYGYKGDQNIRREIRKSSLLGWAVAFVFAVGIVYWFTQFKKDGSVLEGQAIPSDNITQIIERGKEARKIGEFKTAIRYFRKALAIDPNNAEVIVNLSPLLIQVERDLVYSRKLIEKVMKGTHPSKIMRDAGLSLGLADLVDGQLKEASVSIEKAIARDQNFIPSLINREVYSFLSGDDDEVQTSYQRIQRLGSTDGAGAMLAVMSLIRQLGDESKNHKLIVNRALSIIKSYLASSLAYRPHFQIARGYIQGVLLGEQKSFNPSEILNADPYLTENHWHDPLIYREHMHWDEVARWCQEIYKNSKKAPKFDALMAYCLINSNQKLEAGKLLDDALVRNPGDPTLIALQGYYLVSTKNEGKGIGILKVAQKKSSSELALVLLGTHCERPSRRECSKGYWQSLLKRNPNSLAGLNGMAEVYIAENKFDQARLMIDRGLRLSPNYKPLILKRLQMEDDWQKNL